MRLRRIELLCLRAADGLATERDLNILKAAGIDPEDWIQLPENVRSALIAPTRINIVPQVSKELGLTYLPIGQALRDETRIDIVSAVMNAILPEGAESLDESFANDQADALNTENEDIILLKPDFVEQTNEVVDDAIEELVNELPDVEDDSLEQQEVLPQLSIVTDNKELYLDDVEETQSNELVSVASPQEEIEPDVVTPEMLAELEAEFSLGAALRDPNPVDLLSGIMGDLEPEVSDVEPEVSDFEPLEKAQEQQEEVEELFQIPSDMDFPSPDLITQEEVLHIEKEMDISLHDALVPSDSPDILEAVMAKVERIGVPQRHLWLVSSDESLIEVHDDTEETSSGVKVEIQEIRSPYEIDGDSTIARFVLYGTTALLAVAAVALFWTRFIDLDKLQEYTEPQAQPAQDLAAITAEEEVELVEIETLDCEDSSCNAIIGEDAAIIFIDEFEGE